MLMTFFSLHTALYLSLSFLFLILNKLFSPIMMSFCRKSVHSLLGLSDSSTTTTTSATDHHDDEYQRDIINPRAIWSKGLISLVTAATNDATRRRSPNVLESSAMVVAKTPPPRKDPGGIGFIDDIGGGVDGLMSCTESLGFESSDERRVDDDGDELRSLKLSENWSSRRRTRRRVAAEGRRLPPPLSSLDRNGQPSFFLRPVRKDGRLELTEVRINRPEILRAYRGDGRLRLRLIRDSDDDDNDDNDDHENCIKEEPEQEQQQQEEEEERSDVVSSGEERRFPVSSSAGGEGSFRRCQQKLQLHGVWRQHCVSHHQARRLHVAV